MYSILRKSRPKKFALDGDEKTSIPEFSPLKSKHLRRSDHFWLDDICGGVALQDRTALLERALEYQRGSWVYFIQAGENGPIKIGFSDNIKKRMLSLQTAHYEELRLLGAVQGADEMESYLHRKFRRLHIRGEWFRPRWTLTTWIRERDQRKTFMRLAIKQISDEMFAVLDEASKSVMCLTRTRFAASMFLETFQAIPLESLIIPGLHIPLDETYHRK